METLMGIVVGAIIAILIPLRIESLRKPKLKLKLTEPQDSNYENSPASVARFLLVKLVNEQLPRWASWWMSRDAALQCHGTITFHHLDGQNIFGRAMPFRWRASPEPGSIELKFDDKRLFITDRTAFNLEPRMDVYPGEAQQLGVIARFDNEPDCYGWSNESYFSEPKWRNPAWRLPPGRYLVRVTVISAGSKCTSVFRLSNDVSQPDFRLELAAPNDRARD